MAAVEAAVQLDGMLLKGGLKKRVMQRMPPHPLFRSRSLSRNTGEVTLKPSLQKFRTVGERVSPFLRLRIDGKFVSGNG